jgi:nitrogenase subunit NifH
MIKYKVISKTPSITLSITRGRSKEFKQGEIVDQSGYTELFPENFEKVGEVKGLSSFLATPTFIEDPIKEFIKKEEDRKSTSKKYISPIPEDENVYLVDELQEAITEHLQEKYNKDIKEDELEEFIEEFEVKIETEE